MTTEHGFTIGEPTRETPSRTSSYRSKYAAVWAAVELLDDGEWLPVTLATEQSARSFSMGPNRRQYRKRRRGNVVYLGKPAATPADLAEARAADRQHRAVTR